MSTTIREAYQNYIEAAVEETVNEFKRVKGVLVQQRTFAQSEIKPTPVKVDDESNQIVVSQDYDVDDYVDDKSLEEHINSVIGYHLSNFVDMMASTGFNTPQSACSFLACLSEAEDP